MFADNVATLASDTQLFQRLPPSLAWLSLDVMPGYRLGLACITLLARWPRYGNRSAADSPSRIMLLARAISKVHLCLNANIPKVKTTPVD